MTRPAGQQRTPKHSRIEGPWVYFTIAMLESPAFRALSQSALRMLFRLAIEHRAHGGRENGKLIVTYQNFMDYGIDRHAIAPAIRELVALGFVRITSRGGGGNAEHRKPTLYEVTCFPTISTLSTQLVKPTNSWRRIETIEQARQRAAEARAERDSRYNNHSRRWLGQCASSTGVTNATRQRSRELEEWDT